MKLGLPATALALLAAVASGCGDDALSEAPRQVELPEETTAPLPHSPELYTPTGELMESDQTIAGLKVPRGLTATIEQERRHVYVTSIPVRKVQQYFGTRLVTGQVDRLPGGGVAYRGAVPRGVQGGIVHMDVSVIPTGRSETRVEIVEIMPPPVNPPSEEEIRRRLREDAEKAM